MSEVYDNWERLVEAVLKREDLRRLAYCESLSSSISADFSSRFSFNSSFEDASAFSISSETINPEALSNTSSISYREIQRIALQEIKKATKKFNPKLIIGEGGFGLVYKGWIDEQTLTASKPGSGTAVAVKKWNPNSLQGLQEWLEFNAKLSDFGLARDGPTNDMTHVSTRVMGTFGYAAPEYIATGHLTAKCDVYGFGVVLLELLSGRRVMDMNRAPREHNLVDWAKPFLRDKRKLLQIVDPKLEGQCTREVVYTVAALALQCLSIEPKLRPRMAEVLVALEQL